MTSLSWSITPLPSLATLNVPTDFKFNFTIEMPEAFKPNSTESIKTENTKPSDIPTSPGVCSPNNYDTTAKPPKHRPIRPSGINFCPNIKFDLLNNKNETPTSIVGDKTTSRRRERDTPLICIVGDVMRKRKAECDEDNKTASTLQLPEKLLQIQYV